MTSEREPPRNGTFRDSVDLFVERNFPTLRRFSPVAAFVQLARPKQENVVFEHFVRTARKRGLTNWRLALQCAVALIMVRYAEFFPLVMVAQVALQAAVFNVPKNFLKDLKKRGQEVDVLSAPITNRQFGQACHRFFYVMLLMVMVPMALLGLGMILIDVGTVGQIIAKTGTIQTGTAQIYYQYDYRTSYFAFDRPFAFESVPSQGVSFMAFVLAMLWFGYWVSIVRSLTKLPEYIKIVFYTWLGVLCVVYLVWFPLFGHLGFLLEELIRSSSFFSVFLLGMIGGGVIYYLYYSKRYIDRARAKLFN